MSLEDFVVHYNIGQPISLSYMGSISYEDRDQSEIHATFILKNNKWELASVNLNAPKSRLDQYSPPQEKPTPTEY